jgi:hypothetical protein
MSFGSRFTKYFLRFVLQVVYNSFVHIKEPMN